MGKHIEDIHAFPLLLLHPRRQAGMRPPLCHPLLGGGSVTSARSASRRLERGLRWPWGKGGSFSTLGSFMCMWAWSGAFTGAEHTAGTSRWNSSGWAWDDPGWFL